MLHSICVSAVLALLAVTEADPPGPPKAIPSNPAPTRPGTTKPAPAKPGQANPAKPGSTQPMTTKPTTTKSPVAELGIGDPAPKIDVQEFVKGSSVKQFEKGKVYVLEFMALSSDASRESFPFINKLQGDNKDVTFVAVSLDGDAKAVKSAIDRLADKLNFRVAVDARDGENGRMTQSWLEASSQEGIPVCFIVNGDGRVAWIGHPGDLEGPLADIVAGKWDLAAEAAQYKKALAQRKAIARLQDELGLYMKKKDYPGAIKLLDAASKELDLPDEPRMIHLALLAGPGNDADRALALGQKLVEKAAKLDDGAMMMMICRALVDPNSAFPGGAGKGVPSAKVDAKLAALAVQAAEQGEDSEDAESLMVAALAYRAAGQNDKAIAKLDDAADILNGTIESATRSLSDIRALRSSMGGATKPSSTVPKKTLKTGP